MRNFTDVLGDLQAGRVFHELNDALGDVIEGVKETRKVGELILKIKVKPNGQNAVEISDDVIAKVPRPERGKTIMFIDADGSLRREDPRQVKMDLREVEPEPQAEPRDVAEGTAPLREVAAAE